MSYHSDLLEQADLLLRKEPRRPKQASLRRAISAAYYSLFHLLVDAASRLLISGSSREKLRLCVSRAFAHGDMKRVSESFSQGEIPPKVAPALDDLPLEAELRQVAAALVDLQQARHEADYDLSRSFTRQEATDLIGQARTAHTSWASVRNTIQAEVFLTALFALRYIRG